MNGHFFRKGSCGDFEYRRIVAFLKFLEALNCYKGKLDHTSGFHFEWVFYE